jgi:hypothetical protein
MPDSEDRTRRAIDTAWSTDGPSPKTLGVPPNQRRVFGLVAGVGFEPT